MLACLLIYTVSIILFVGTATSWCFITSRIFDTFRPGNYYNSLNWNFCGDSDRLKNITTNLF